MWKELKQKIAEKNDNGSSVRIEWSSEGKEGKGILTKININGDIEFFITDDKPEIGSFVLKSSRNIIGISPQTGDDLYIFSHFMGSIMIFHGYNMCEFAKKVHQ